jgi:hypothetical protein
LIVVGFTGLYGLGSGGGEGKGMLSEIPLAIAFNTSELSGMASAIAWRIPSFVGKSIRETMASARALISSLVMAFPFWAVSGYQAVPIVWVF